MRDIFVSGAAKLISTAGKYAPRLTVRAMERFAFGSQKGQTPAQDRERNGLHKPSGGGQERGNYEGHVAESSVYTTGGLLLAGAGLAYAVVRGRDKNDKSMSH